MRTNRMWLGMGMLAVSTVLGLGCSGAAPSSDAACSVGAESCACTAGGGCDEGLTCLSSICVDAGGTNGSGGGSSSGGAAGASSGSGSTGGTSATGGAGGSSETGGVGGSSTAGGGGTGGTAGSGGTGGTNGDAGDGGDAEIESACAAMAAAFCQKDAECMPLDLQSRFGDLETCKARRMKVCLPYARLPGTSETAEKKLACASALNAASCSEWVYDFDRVLSVCRDQPGTLSNGATCSSNAQCQTAMCVAKENATCGLCGPARGPGEACTYSGDCAGQIPCVNGTCVKPAGAGSLCTVNDQCAVGLVCKAGSCASPAQLGESCATTPCDPKQWLFCGSSNRVCQKWRLAAPGEGCSPSAGLVCDHGGVCRTIADSGTGTCLAAAADGAMCSTTAGPFCMAYSQCQNGTCQPPNPAVCK